MIRKKPDSGFFQLSEISCLIIFVVYVLFHEVSCIGLAFNLPHLLKCIYHLLFLFKKFSARAEKVHYKFPTIAIYKFGPYSKVTGI
jgi:hypothetical protein